ncbi:MAG: S8 family serine peptidase [Tagaea sp.]|nr:S8 family serine peptidase [Tagaea sp.]
MRYLLRPKSVSVDMASASAQAKVGRKHRKSQLARVRAARSEGGAKLLAEWLGDIVSALPAEYRKPARTALRAARELAHAGVPRKLARFDLSGFDLLEMTVEQARKLAADMPNMDLIEDSPLSLIEPAIGLGAKTTLDAQTDLWHLAELGLPAARAKGSVGSGEGTSIAILDTGIADHPELTGRLDPGVKADGAAKTTQALNAPRDDRGHGTHVAGLAAGRTVGAAPGARVVSVVCLPGYMSDLILAFEWAAAQPEISVINLSGGIPGYAPGMEAVVDMAYAAGIVPVVAIGNEGRSTSRSPGNYAKPLSVGASTQDRKVAGFSGGGTINVAGLTHTVPDLVAPGEAVWSCVKGGGYEAWNGTSMAAPLVSGLAALIVERHPDIAASDVADMLLAGCLDLGLPRERQGAGLTRIA